MHVFLVFFCFWKQFSARLPSTSFWHSSTFLNPFFYPFLFLSLFTFLPLFSGPGTESKPGVGKDKVYKAPEYFQSELYSFYDHEKSLIDKRLPQPKSGLSEFW